MNSNGESILIIGTHFFNITGTSTILDKGFFVHCKNMRELIKMAITIMKCRVIFDEVKIFE